MSRRDLILVMLAALLILSFMLGAIGIDFLEWLK